MRISCRPGVRTEVVEQVRSFARWAERELELLHPIRVRITPDDLLYGTEPFRLRDDEVLAGKFMAPEGRYGAAVIELAGDWSPVEVVTTLAHELVHYEQWRDRRPLNERGVDNRAVALVRRWEEST